MVFFDKKEGYLYSICDGAQWEIESHNYIQGRLTHGETNTII